MKSYLTRTNIFLLFVCLCVICFIGAVQAILLPFVLSFILAYILHPLSAKLEKCRISQGFSSLLVTFGFCCLVVMVFLIVVPILQAQVVDFMRRIPQFSSSVWDYLKGVISYTKENITSEQMSELSVAVRDSVVNVLMAIGAGLSQILSSGIAIFNVLALIVITPVVLFYILRDWGKIQRQVKSVIPKDKEDLVQSVWKEINNTLSGFIRGQAMVCLLLGIFYGIGLSAVGLDFGMLVGLLAGVLSFVPYFGFGTGLVLSVFLALMQNFTMGQWGGLAAIFIVGQVLESYILTPYLVGDKVGLHPVWVIFALLAGGVLAGFIGILIAVPTAGVIGVLLRRFLKWYRTTDFYLGTGKVKK